MTDYGILYCKVLAFTHNFDTEIKNKKQLITSEQLLKR